MWRWVVLLAGCNEVYGLDSTKQRDALVLFDEDQDTIVDLEDNCPKTPNPDQSNADGDQLGDRCDNCPILDSPITDDADNDGIGDICDPHPKGAGDCLLLVDNFRDKQQFAQHWSAVTAMGATVTAEDGHVLVRAPAGDAIVTENASSGRTDVLLRGRTITDSSVLAVSSTPDQKLFYSCRLVAPSTFDAGGPGTAPTVFSLLVPADTIGRNFVLRLSSIDNATPTTPIATSCRVDYGVSVGTTQRDFLDSIAGKAGFSVAGGETVIEAISLSRYEQDSPCPATIYR
jgi:hypothetical protein